jgi:hypothetical protein
LSLVQVGAKVILVQLYLNSVCGMLGTVGGDEAQTLVCLDDNLGLCHQGDPLRFQLGFRHASWQLYRLASDRGDLTHLFGPVDPII